MPYNIEMGTDGILQMAFVGDVDTEDIDEVMAELEAYMETATETEPLCVLSNVSQAGKLSASARKGLASMGMDPRMGRNAIVGVNRYQRVMASFVIKASGHDDLRFFDSEAEALTWLKAGSQG
jgi:hypothetical protein